jgi:acetylornithine deacetylase/succinyl-diaminopimelate desuccinylase-like protein
MEEILRKLVSFHTVEDDRSAIHQALDYIATFVADRGMHVERFESDGHESLIATITPGNKTPKVILAAHLDVVPAEEELFQLRQADGRFYGRGVLDMKFAIAAYLQLVDELQASLKDYDFGLVITTDEEQGGLSTQKLLAEGYRPKICILPDGGDNWQIQLSSKGFYYLQIRKYGTPAHGSRPWLGVNAILPIMDILQEIKGLFGELTAENPTLNIGTINGGAAINQVADYAEASIDIRGTEAQKRPLLKQIRAICSKHDAELHIILDGAATRFDINHPLIAPFAKEITSVTGIEVTGSHTLGSNDTRFYAERNIPCISLYPTGAGHHGPEEWMSEQAFFQFKEVLGNYLDAVAKR